MKAEVTCIERDSALRRHEITLRVTGSDGREAYIPIHITDQAARKLPEEGMEILLAVASCGCLIGRVERCGQRLTS